MNKAAWAMLERLFTAEMSDSLPLQTKSKVMLVLEREGLAQRMVGKMGGFPPVTVEGWGLTQAGHIRYCEWAAKQPGNPI